MTPEQLAAALSALSRGEVPTLPDGKEIDLGGGSSRWLGAWVPGTDGDTFPAGTGLAIQPGEVLIVQIHYNTSSVSPTADQSQVVFDVAPTVAHAAFVLPFTDLGWVTGLSLLGPAMEIPAGDPSVTLSSDVDVDGLMFGRARSAIGLAPGEPLRLHAVGQHMHQLGTSGRIEKVSSAGEETCLLSLPHWDFHWQGAYTLARPVDLASGDAVRISCTWDNSAENQTTPGAEPRDVAWGEGTGDEMCLGTAFLTAAY